MLRIRKVDYMIDYKLKILFSNQKVKIVDLESWIFENNVYLKPLRDIQYFKKVRIDDEGYSICWPNGADFCPDTLFAVGEGVGSKSGVLKSKSRKIPTKSKKKVSRFAL